MYYHKKCNFKNNLSPFLLYAVIIPALSLRIRYHKSTTMRSLITFCSILFTVLNVHAASIRGIVTDEKNSPIEFSNIILHKSHDSNYLNGTTTDSLGRFVLDNLEAGQYYLEVVYLGYKPDTIEQIDLKEDADIGTVQLFTEENMLSGVEIKANRPVIERQADKLIFNVENSTRSSGENVFDILRTVPGVTVSGNDQISINGKSGVQVMINGKIEQLSTDQLATLLKSMQSSNVKKIEVVSNPSAKYDANARGGILNIQLKSNLRTGVNGSVYANYRQHRYANGDVGFNLNMNHKKLTISTNYNFGHNNNYGKNIFIRNFKTDEGTQQYDETGIGGDKFVSHFANLSLRYAINDNNAIGIGGELFRFINTGGGDARLNILNNVESGIINTYQNTDNQTSGKSINPSLNFNFRSQLDTAGSVLEIKYDYTYFYLFSESHLSTDYFDSAGTVIAPNYDFRQTNPFIVNLHTAKADYSRPLKNKHSIEAGAKFTWTKTSNDIRFYNLISDVYQQDNTKSNQFEYIENINALYTTWSKDWGKGWSTNTGLRIEQTNTNQYSVTLDSRTKRHYVDFFPSVFMQKNIKEHHQVNLNYSRKIQRPNYNDLNPFQFYQSPYSVWTGNADLKPQYINVTEFTYTLRNSYSFTAGHENIRNNYTHLAYQDDSTKITTYKATNFRVRNNLNIGFNINKEIFKWWMISYSGQYTFFKYNSTVNNEPFVVSSNKFTISMDNTFILPKDFKINIFGFYTTPFLDATDIMKSDGLVNVAVSKSFFQNALRIRVAGNDIFATKNFSFDTDFFNVNSKTRRKFSSRFFSLSVTYNFQKGKKFQQTRISNSNQEEKNRIR